MLSDVLQRGTFTAKYANGKGVYPPPPPIPPIKSGSLCQICVPLRNLRVDPRRSNPAKPASATTMGGASKVLCGAYRLLFGSHKVLYGAYKVLYGANKVLYGANKVLYGANKVLYGAYKVLFAPSMVKDMAKCPVSGQVWG